MSDDTFFVLKAPASTPSPSGERQNNDLGYNPGFRLGAAYEFPESRRRLELDYRYLDVEQDQRVSGDFLFATVGPPDLTSAFGNYSGSAKADVDLSYQRLNAAFVQPWTVSDLDVGFRFGFEYAYLQIGQELRYDDLSILGVGGEQPATCAALKLPPRWLTIVARGPRSTAGISAKGTGARTKHRSIVPGGSDSDAGVGDPRGVRWCGRSARPPPSRRRPAAPSRRRAPCRAWCR